MKSFKQYITEVQRYEMEMPNASNLDPLVNAMNLMNIWGQISPYIANAPYYVDKYKETMGEILPQLALLPIYARAPVNAFDANQFELIPPELQVPSEPGWVKEGEGYEYYEKPNWDDKPGAWVWDRGRWRNILTREVYPPEYDPINIPQDQEIPIPKPSKPAPIDPTRWYRPSEQTQGNSEEQGTGLE